MRDARLTKLWRDTRLHPARTLLVLLAMALGLAGAGALLTTYALVDDARHRQHLASRPAQATLTFDSIDAELVDAVRALPGVEAARARRTVRASVGVGGTWRAAVLHVLDDFESAEIARLRPDGGAWPPDDAGVALERSSVEFAGAALGAPLSIAYRERDAVELPVRAIVRDVSLAPGWMENVVYVFATPALAQRLGVPAGFDEIQFRGAGDPDRAAVRAVARRVRALADARGSRLLRADVPEPNEHVHEAQMRSMLITQGAFALLCLLASGLLVFNLFAALLAGQGRELAVMKTLGADPGGLTRLYLGYAAALGLVAGAVALPVALVAGRRYAALKTEMLNFDATALEVGALPIAVLLLTAVLLPALAAYGPIRRAARRGVVAALADHGADAPAPGAWWGALPLRAALQRPLLLALGNTLRRRGRAVLTVLALALGGAVGLGASSLRDGVVGSVDLMFSSMRYDVLLTWRREEPAETVAARARGVDGVDAAEAWTLASATLEVDGLPTTTLPLQGVPVDGELVAARLEGGRWLRADETDAIVATRRLLSTAGAKIGDTLTLRIGTRPARAWRVVGVADFGPMAHAYAPRSAVAAAAGDDARTALAVRLARRDLAGQIDAIQSLRDAFVEDGRPVARSARPDENRRVVEDHLLMVVEFLGAMGWLMVGIGGMGLASTMGISVLERRREIGVLRAIGTLHRTIVALVLLEGAALAIASWLVAIVLSIPIGRVLGDAFGRVMFEVPPVGAPGAAAIATALALTLGLAALACLVPARHALRIPAAQAVQAN